MDIKTELRKFIVATQDQSSDIQATNQILANVVDAKVKQRYDAELEQIKLETES